MFMMVVVVVVVVMWFGVIWSICRWHLGLLAAVRDVLRVLDRTSPAAMAGAGAVSTDLTASVRAAERVGIAVAGRVAGGVVRVSDDLVRDVLLLRQQLLEPDDGGQHERDLADEQSLAGDQGDRTEQQRQQGGGLQRNGEQQRAQDLGGLLLLATSLTTGRSLRLFLIVRIGGEQVLRDVLEGAAGRGHGIDDVRALQVDLDGVRGEEGLDAGQQQRLERLIAAERTGSTLGFGHAGSLDHGHAVGQGEHAALGHDTIDEAEQLVLDARHRVGRQALLVDAADQVALATTDRIAGRTARIFGRQGHGHG